MKYLLDTNICIYIIKKKPIAVIENLLRFNPGDVAISTITVAELNYGIAKSSRPIENAIALEQFMQPLSIIDYSSGDALVYGEIRVALEKKGTPIGAMDLLIASQAVNRNLILATNNEKEFKRIKELRIENWTK